MSRSIHQNTSWRYWQKHGPHGDEDWEAQFRKSKIKRLVRVGRKSSEKLFRPVKPEEIQYSIEELRPPLFFPATLEDVKGVMAELPMGFLNGVAHIKFLAGREYINANESIEGEVYDPVLGRKSIEIAPGVYEPIVLGTYSQQTGGIQLFAYAHDPSVTLSDTKELILKLRMLQTLVHELAHNHDRSQRVARGRWRMDDYDKAETYANRITRELFDSVIIPYARRVYGLPSSEDCAVRSCRLARFCNWLKTTLKIHAF